MGRGRIAGYVAAVLVVVSSLALTASPAGAAELAPSRGASSSALAAASPTNESDLHGLRDAVVTELTTGALTRFGAATVELDERAGRVIVGVTGDVASATAALGARFGREVVVEAITSPKPATRTDPAQTMKGGLEISSSESLVCTSSFGAHRGGQRYVMTAGHCGSNGSTWRIGSNSATPYFGTASRRTFVTGSSTDSESITVADAKGGPNDCVYESDSLCRPVMGFANLLVQGENVCKSGRTTGVTCGAIRSTDVTVIYSGENVSIQHLVSACVTLDSGDSGSPIYLQVGGSAIGAGILSGSSSTTTSCGGNILLPATIMYFSRWSKAMNTPGQLPLRPGYRELTEFTGDTCADVLAKWGTLLFSYAGNCAGGFASSYQYLNQGWEIFDQIDRTPDFSGDGCADVLARNPTDGRLWLYRGSCSGGFVQGGGVPIDSGWAAYSLVLAPGDFTGDGCADVLGITPSGAMVRYPGRCDGALVQGGGVVMNQGWNVFSQVLTPGDFDGDGCADLIGITPGGDMYLYRGDCAGGFLGGGQLINTGWNVFSQVTTPGDFSGDGCPDLLARTPDGVLFLYQGDCNGGFLGGGYAFNQGWNLFDDVF